MACLLKIPSGDKRGVVSFTTQEQRIINADSALLSALIALRKRYVIGLHFNWHNHQFSPDQKFDFCMAGEGDLIPAKDTPFRLFPMDACNFTPSIYAPDQSGKFWDILIIGNPVSFKRPEVALRTIRKLFDQSDRKLRVLYICPMPKYRRGDLFSVFYDVRKYYESLFSREERNWFTLLTTTFNSPFPFDRETLSVFFRNSRVFLHCATEERRCRIAAYAWCAGLPVVAYPSVASILPESLQAEPGYYRVEDDADYPSVLLRALSNVDRFDPTAYRRALSETYMTSNLDQQLAKVFEEMELPYSDSPLLGRNLDIRLGWHHQGIGGASNGLIQPLSEFMKILSTLDALTEPNAADLTSSDYPERVLAGERSEQGLDSAEKVAEKSLYLNPNRLWIRICRAIAVRVGLN